MQAEETEEAPHQIVGINRNLSYGLFSKGSSRWHADGKYKQRHRNPKKKQDFSAKVALHSRPGHPRSFVYPKVGRGSGPWDSDSHSGNGSGSVAAPVTMITAAQGILAEEEENASGE